jgi:hypothetical protein
MASHCFTEPRTYRGWDISFDYPSIPLRSFDYSASHPDYDGAPDAHDSRLVHGATVSEVMNEIDLWYEEQGL